MFLSENYLQSVRRNVVRHPITVKLYDLGSEVRDSDLSGRSLSSPSFGSESEVHQTGSGEVLKRPKKNSTVLPVAHSPVWVFFELFL